MNTKWKWSHTYESICNGSLSWTDIISLWSDRVDDTGMFGWKEKAVTDSPQWQEKPSSSAAEQSVEGWTDQSSLTEHTNLFSSCVWDIQAIISGRSQSGRGLRVKTSPVQSECRKVLTLRRASANVYSPLIAFLIRFIVNIYFWYTMRVRYTF